MGMIIESGNGNGQSAAVSSTGNRLDTSARANSRIYYISRDDGRAFAIYSEDDDAAAGDFVLYFKNTDVERKFYIEDVIVSSENAATWKLHCVTGTGSGTAITPTNMNLTSGNVADATILGNGAVSGLTSARTIDSVRTTANSTSDTNLKDALIIGFDDAIAIEYDTGTTGDCEVTLIGYFDVE